MAINTTTVEVVMPAMGDSVSEGTVLEWHKTEGDSVAADETLVEISTDKVDAEVPAPIDGTVVKVHAAEGDTVHVGALLAEISPTNGAGPAQPDAPAAPAEVVDIVMPAMGESVAEGVVLEWAKQVGDSIEADETIVEISTDKVDAEVPAPASGTVTEILAQPGDTVTVGQVIGRMTGRRRRRAGARRAPGGRGDAGRGGGPRGLADHAGRQARRRRPRHRRRPCGGQRPGRANRQGGRARGRERRAERRCSRPGPR